jgi:RNA polymerase sigma-70 factor, ECF subfamily
VSPAGIARVTIPRPAVGRRVSFAAVGAEREISMDAALGDGSNELRDDEELVSLAQAGDKAAMAELLERHFDYVHHVCRYILVITDHVEDARQEALLQAARKITTFSGRSAFRTWLHAVTKNVCLQAIQERHDTLVEDFDDEDDTDAGDEIVAVTYRIDVDAALLALSAPLREVVVLFYRADLDQDDIAKLLGISRVTVATRLHNARKKLKAIFARSADADWLAIEEQVR